MKDFLEDFIADIRPEFEKTWVSLDGRQKLATLAAFVFCAAMLALFSRNEGSEASCKFLANSEFA